MEEMALTDGAPEDLSGPPQGLFRWGLGEGWAAKLSPFQIDRDLKTTGERMGPSLLGPSCWQTPPWCSQKTSILLSTATCCQTEEVGPCEPGGPDGPATPSHHPKSILCWTSSWESKYSSPSPEARERVELFIRICVSVVYLRRRGNFTRRSGTYLKTWCILGSIGAGQVEQHTNTKCSLPNWAEI